jgi:glyoxylase-like metal-dependent hydrolase (beta-lactamase superfamily II)
MLAQQLDGRPLGDGLELFQVRPNFYVLAGAGANIAIQVGADGAVVVDAGDAAHADRAVAELKKLATQPIRYVIDTSGDPDHVAGNEPLAKAGRTIFQIGNAFNDAMTNGGAAAILAAEGVLRRMSAPTGEASAYPVAAWPTETFAQSRKYMYLNDEGIEVLHQPAAHTDGDSIVYFRRSDVVVAGDIVDMRHFPVIDVGRGGSIHGEIAALNRLVDLAIPSVPLVSREAGTVVVPGHGYLLDQTDVAEYRDMVTIVRDRINYWMEQGKSLADIKAANPAQGYRTRYGSDSGPWTTDMFVEAVFKSLSAGTPQRR